MAIFELAYRMFGKRDAREITARHAEEETLRKKHKFIKNQQHENKSTSKIVNSLP